MQAVSGTTRRMKRGIGLGRFELPTSPTRTERATRLRHSPNAVYLSDAGLSGVQPHVFNISRNADFERSLRYARGSHPAMRCSVTWATWFHGRAWTRARAAAGDAGRGPRGRRGHLRLLADRGPGRVAHRRLSGLVTAGGSGRTSHAPVRGARNGVATGRPGHGGGGPGARHARGPCATTPRRRGGGRHPDRRPSRAFGGGAPAAPC